MRYSGFDTRWLGEMNWITFLILIITLPITLPLALIGIGPGTLIAFFIFAWFAGIVVNICQYLASLL
jgi:hypothetical protein